MDKTDFERFCREHWQAMWAYARRRTDPAVDAADVVSEVFLVAWRRREEIPPGDAERLWLYGVARHTVINARRGTVRRSRLHAQLAAVADLVDLVGPDPQDLVSARTGREAMTAALAGLAERDRELLALIGWEGLTPAAAAEVLGLRPATVRVHLHRARQRLRRAMEEPAPAPTTSVRFTGFPPAVKKELT